MNADNSPQRPKFAANSPPPQSATCEVCGKRFRAYLSSAKFCSSTCRSRAWRANR